MYDGHGFGGGGFMWIFWIALVALIFWGGRSYTNSSSRLLEKKSALGILKERYAKGEIDKAEFESKKRDLV